MKFLTLHSAILLVSLSQCSSLSSSGNQNPNWKQAGKEIDQGLCKLSQSEIQNLITQRNKARRSQNFQLADSFLGKLQKNNVYLDDKKKLWRADGESFQQVPQYRKSPNSKPITAREEAFVQIKVNERAEAKFARNFSLADDILDELRFLKNVDVDDSTRTWRVVEPFRTVYEFGGKRLNNIPEDALQQINQLLRDRFVAKENKNYKEADDILKTLEVDFGVRVDDEKKAWFFLPKDLPETSSQQSSINQENLTFTSSHNKHTLPAIEDIPDGISIVEDYESPIMNSCIEVERSKDNIPERIDIIKETLHSKIVQNTDLNTLTVVQLKDKLRQGGLPVSGRKADLILRLMNN